MRIENFMIPLALIGQPLDPIVSCSDAEEEPITFYLVRHGETEWNEKKEIINPYGEVCMGPLIQGSSDIPLNENGEKQAVEAGKKIVKLQFPIDAIYTSPLKRAAKTAKVIAEQVGIVPMEEKDLAACSWGVCEGRSKVYRAENYSYNLSGSYRPEGWEKMPIRERWSIENVIEGAESRQSLIDRMRSAFKRIAADSKPGSSIFVVTHQENILSFSLHCQEEDLEKKRLLGDLEAIESLENGKIGLDNCSIHKFNYKAATDRFEYLGRVEA